MVKNKTNSESTIDVNNKLCVIIQIVLLLVMIVSGIVVNVCNLDKNIITEICDWCLSLIILLMFIPQLNNKKKKK